MIALGALSAVLTDQAAAYRHRLVAMTLPQLLGVAGAFATLAARGSWAEPWVLPLLGLVAGVLACVSLEGSLAAMILLMDAEVAMDLPLPGPIWHTPTLLLVGGLSVLALALGGWPFFGDRTERTLLAQCLAGCADVLAPEAAGPAGAARRRALHDALERARRAGAVGGSPLLARRLPGVAALAELASAVSTASTAPVATASAGSVAATGSPTPAAPSASVAASAAVPGAAAAATAATASAVASAVASGSAAGSATQGSGVSPALLRRLREAASSGPEAARRPWPEPAHALDAQILRAARTAVEAPPAPAAATTAATRPPRRTHHQRAVVRGAFTDPLSWWSGLRLAVALLLAEAAAAYAHLPHPYWAVLNVTFVCRPDIAPVTGRALERLGGTTLGLLCSGLVFALGGPVWTLVATLGAAAALVPALAVTGYLYQSAALGTIVLMLTQLAGDPGLPLLVPGFVLCAIGCLASALSTELIGPRLRDPALARRLAGAVDQAALALAPHRPHTTAPRPAAAPRAHQQLALVRSEFDRARREPPWRQATTPLWSALIDDVERLIDTALATHPTAAPLTSADHDRLNATRRHLRHLSTTLHRLPTSRALGAVQSRQTTG